MHAGPRTTMAHAAARFKPERRAHKRHPCRLSCLIAFAVAVLLCFCCCSVDAQAGTSCAPPSSNSYDWEGYNYYQILDLSPQEETEKQKPRKQRRKERAKFKSADIRKAYRKQAQLYHPDKIASKKQTGNSTTTLTQEESTARFARIAEAYEVLNDDEKREEYDEFLLECEDRLARETESRNQGGSDSRWSFFEDVSTDPWRVFEDFFFGPSFQQPQQQHGSSWDDNVYGGAQHSHSATPQRVFQREEFHYDPYRGVEIMRVLNIEEYDVDPRSGAYLYRVIGQDFVEQHDPFHGWEYHPISQPFVVEEGYRQDQDYSSFDTDQFGHEASRQFVDRILPGEVLYPSSENLLTSSNGRYYAGISAQCELLIMSDSSRLGADVEDKIIWSSETFVPASHLATAGGCFLSLQGPRLVLALGTPERPGSILWYSEVSHTEQSMVQPDPSATYFARLDDDGSLAVYCERLVDLDSQDTESSEYFQPKRSSPSPIWWSKLSQKMESFTWWTRFLEKTKAVPRTRAAKAWVSLRKRVAQTLFGRNSKRSPAQDETDTMTEETCIYATGLVGCHSSARKLLHVAKDVKQTVSHRVKHTMTRIDKVMDDFTDYLNEEVEEDDDVLDTVLRVLNAAGRGIGRAGQKVVRRGARAVRNSVASHLGRLKKTSR